MAKKKSAKSVKKHQFKASAPEARATVSGESGAVTAFKTAPKAVNSGATVRDFRYVGHDTKRIVVFGGGLIVLELILWLAFNNTDLGNSVYQLIKV